MAEIVVITQGTSGVGRAFARGLAKHGAKIAILGRGLDELRDTAVDLVTRGAAAALAIPCDVSDSAMVERATRRIEAELGPIDIWIDAEPEPPRASVRGRAWGIGLLAAGVAGVAAVAIVRRSRRYRRAGAPGG